MFFGGSIEKAVSTYFSDSKSTLSNEQIAELHAIIEEAKKRKNKGDK